MEQEQSFGNKGLGLWWALVFAASLSAVVLPLKAFGFGDLSLSEVFYDRIGPDNGFEWVELYNAGSAAIALDTWSLGYGGTSYAQGTLQLHGSVVPGQYFVVGGPTSDVSNGFPLLDLALDFSPDLQNSGSTADGVALFDVEADQITSTLVPADVVIFGDTNSNGLLGPDGTPGLVMVGDAPNGQSIELTPSGLWRIQPLPNPGTGDLGATASVPEPRSLGLLGLGLGLLLSARASPPLASCGQSRASGIFDKFTAYGRALPRVRLGSVCSDSKGMSQ